MTVPLFWSPEGHTAPVVSCRKGHIASREAFEECGCPYCNRTDGERAAYLEGLKAGKRTAT